MFWIILVGIIATLCAIAYVFLSIIHNKIQRFETRVIQMFTKRTDMFPALFEVSRDTLQRHEEIFQEALDLRKREFALIETTKNFKNIVDIEKYIHHEINFIFQVCNKHHLLEQNKNFLYLRDCIVTKSHALGKDINKYKHVIESYNKIIRIKNYTIIGYLLPFSKKPTV